VEINLTNSQTKSELDISDRLNRSQRAGLLTLRIFIGWHFLYEGIIKWTDPEWSAAGFLKSSKWILAGFFTWLAENDVLLILVDFLNQTGLVIIGIALIAGLFTRPAAISGMVLLGLYYLAHPPLFDGGLVSAGGDRYLLIDKNLIEMAGLYLLFAFHSGKILGLDALIQLWRKV